MEPLPKIEDWPKFRSRIEYEDNLLNQRVNVFLVVNGIGAAAFGLLKNTAEQTLLSGAIALADILVLICTYQTAGIIRDLSREYIRDANDPIDKRVRISLKWVPRQLKSTYILGIWLPLSITFAWLLAFVLLV